MQCIISNPIHLLRIVHSSSSKQPESIYIQPATSLSKTSPASPNLGPTVLSIVFNQPVGCVYGYVTIRELRTIDLFESLPVAYVLFTCFDMHYVWLGAATMQLPNEQPLLPCQAHVLHIGSEMDFAKSFAPHATCIVERGYSNDFN